MSLPNLPYEDNLRREVRTEWGGINLNENAGDGELIEAVNMSSRAFPLLASAVKPKIITGGTVSARPWHLYATHNHWYWARIGVNTTFVRDGTDVGPLGQDLVGKIRYAELGGKLYIFPCKKVYDIESNTLSDMESSVTITADIEGSTLYGVPAEANTIIANTTWSSYFRVGDGVTISGCDDDRNNGTFIVREIQSDNLRFYENTFAADRIFHIGSIEAGNYYFELGGETYGFTVVNDLTDGYLEYRAGDQKAKYWNSAKTSYIEMSVTAGSTTGLLLPCTVGMHNQTLTVARKIPNLIRVCADDNRLWGTDGEVIYASKLGDPLNFNVFDGLSTDSWAAPYDDGIGAFTGCCVFQGYPIFFKRGGTYRVVGDEPSNYSISPLHFGGTIADRSIVEIRGKLYYCGDNGVMEWSGSGFPNTVSAALGYDTIFSAGNGTIAGTDGSRYYVYLGVLTAGGWTGGLCVYDPRFGTWHTGKTRAEDNNYYEFATDIANNKHWVAAEDRGPNGKTHYIRQMLWAPEDVDTGDQPLDWSVTFADSTRVYKSVLTGSEGKKGVLRLLIRCKLTGTMTVWISYDGGEFTEVDTIKPTDKNTFVVPLILRRCDRWQLRLTGRAQVVIYSISVERYGGEWQQAE